MSDRPAYFYQQLQCLQKQFGLRNIRKQTKHLLLKLRNKRKRHWLPILYFNLRWTGTPQE